MRSWSFTVFLLLVTVASNYGQAKKLPSGIKACSRSDTDFDTCTLNAANDAIPFLVKGVPSFGIAPLDPMRISEIKVDDNGKSRQFTIDLILRDLKVTGFRHLKLSEVKINPESGEMKFTGFAPKLVFVGKYNVTARLLVLPIVSSDIVNITLENVTFTHKLRMKRDGDFATPVDNDLEFETTRPRINLKNFINGNKLLSDQVREFFNENWKEVVSDLGPPIAEGLKLVSTHVFSAIFSKVPYNDIFPE